MKPTPHPERPTTLLLPARVTARRGATGLARRLVVTALTLSACVMWAAPASAGSHSPAKERQALALTAQAKAAYKAERYPQAALLFQKAYAQVPEPTLLFNAARSYQRGRYLREARSLFQLYLTLATYDDDETRAGRAEAREHMAAIDRRLRQVAAERRAAAAKAAAAANAGPVAKAGPAVKAEPAVTRPAPTPQPTSPGAAGGAGKGPPPAILTIPPPKTLKPVRRPGLFSRVSATRWTEREIAAVSLMSGGAAVVVTGLILHAVASGTASDFDADLAKGKTTQGGVTFYPGLSQTAAQDAIDRENGLRLGGSMLLGLGTVAVGVGVWLWLGRSLDGDNKLSLAPSVGPDGWGWALQGRF